MSRRPYQQDMLEDLLNSLLDETLSDIEEARLAGMLAESETARTRYREWMELHAALHWDYASAAAQHAPHVISGHSGYGSLDDVNAAAADAHRRRGRRSLVVGGSFAAAGLLALAISWFAVLPRPGDFAEFQASLAKPLPTGKIVEITALGGAASWSVGGIVVSDLAVGHRLDAGTVNLEGEPAFMILRFDDGTEITLAGDSMLEFDARSQKTLAVRHGTLSVDAKPQPPGRPMLVRTPTAEVEVVGTLFSLSADSQVTHVGVEEGSVRFVRLADGRSVEVREHTTATASLVATDPLEASSQAFIPQTYRENFGGLPIGTDGVRAVPFIAGRRYDGLPAVHYGVSVKKSSLGFVTVHDDSVVSVRFRAATPETIRVMLSTRRSGGGFSGNFEAKFPASAASPVDAAAGEAGWRRIDIPLREFAAIVEEFPSLSPGQTVAMLLIDAFTSEAQLEVAEVIVRRQAGGTEAR